ncbi:AI-2E family transporter [Yinghuangia soli]|uniref:AI-2E family transporter n=1 Tax=Yinghuangia soli TaxID=2908204 RepID=A0AA41Q762_9ACTN|nr:AI-2E family transporter [Yinghuangia soli]MCF2531417.1 AI-2E family transporter [Yinghuangia soli]
MSTDTTADTSDAADASDTNGGTAAGAADRTTSAPPASAAPGAAPAGKSAGPAAPAAGAAPVPGPAPAPVYDWIDPSIPAPRFGEPGRPLRRSSPFYVGFFGGLGLITAWFLAQAFTGIKDVIVLVAISFFLAAGLNPFVERLQRVGLPRKWAVVTVGLGFLLVIAGFITAIAQPLAEQTTDLINSIPDKLTELLHNEQFKKLDEKYDIIEKAKEAAASANTAESVAGGLLGFGKLILNSVFDTLTVLCLTLYFLGSLPGIKEAIYRLFPASRRPRVRALGNEIIGGIGGYVNGMLLVATCAGVSSFVFLTVIDLEYALPLALIVALTDLIPMIGATIGAVVVSAVAFFDSPGKALICIIFYVCYQQFENYLVYPKVMKRVINVPPALTVIAALIGAALLGVTGALLAIPVAAAVLLIIREVVTPRQDKV